MYELVQSHEWRLAAVQMESGLAWGGNFVTQHLCVTIVCTDLPGAGAWETDVLLPCTGEPMPHTTPYRNRLLRLLSSNDLSLLGTIEAVDIAVRDVLEPADANIESVYFVETGFASVVADAYSDDPIEIGLIGSEGMTGVAILLGDTQSPLETFVQGGGTAWKAEAASVRNALLQSPSLRTHFLLYTRSFISQLASIAAANGRATIGARLARWLLMVEDRMGHSFPMTHDLLGMMLAVHRPGVTRALQALEASGLISTTRGSIEVIDRKGLIEASHGSYGVAEREYLRLFPSSARPPAS